MMKILRCCLPSAWPRGFVALLSFALLVQGSAWGLNVPRLHQNEGVLLVPGLVLGLRHNLNQERDPSGRYIVLFSAPAAAPVRHMIGGDCCLPDDEEEPYSVRGYEWWMIRDDPTSNPASWRLPPGVVLGLKHSLNQAAVSITVFGYDPAAGPNSLPGFQRQIGGDLGESGGHGYYWYESTGEGFSDWSLLDQLPRWTVVGLKHSVNQVNKSFTWQGQRYDPADPTIAPPPGFVRVVGGDIGALPGVGYCWYEKVTGPEVVVRPSLTVTLDRSLILGSQDNFELYQDRDHDFLIDDLENALANTFRPYCIFDSDETARQSYEPVTLFQVRPLDLSRDSDLRIRIKWVFLFRQDGGYGPASSTCRDKHEGDNDDAVYDLGSSDGGITWTLLRAGLSFGGLEWPTNSRLEVYDVMHPIIYMSGSKHHEYFTKDRDHRDSLYSDPPIGDKCNEDVNGLGAQVLVDLQSLTNGSGRFNNVGEPGQGNHDSPPFVDDLGRYYPGHSAWGSNDFYEVDPTSGKWMTGEIVGVIYVDRNFIGDEQGTSTQPFNTVGEANTAARDGTRIKIQAGDYPETVTFTKRVIIFSRGGTVTIGK